MISDDHEQRILLPRGITAAQAEAHGVRSVLDPADLPDELKNSKYATGSGLLFPWNSPISGTVWQFRPDEPIANPQGDPVKYVFGHGQQMVLNQLRITEEGPLLVQEGTMQSLAAAVYAHEGWSVAGMSGCWSWRKGETQVAIPDLMICDGRDVVIGLDADAATNRDVYDAGTALKEAILAEGAHAVHFLWLSGHGQKAGLDDVLGTRPAERRTEYLMRALQHVEEKPAKARPAKKTRGTIALADPSRPTIMINDDRRDVINSLTDALRARFDGDTLFGYGGILARRDNAVVTPITDGMFADLAAEAALCVTINAKGDANPAWPDEKTCKAVLSRSDRFSQLERISQVPFVRPDGSICQTPGYDEETATFLVLDESIERVDVPDTPSGDEVRWAVKLLTEEWLGDLFAIMPEPEDKANCLAMILTPLIRGLVPLAPLAVVDGLQMGVGKNLLADLLSIMVHGKPAKPLPYSLEDEENKKVITASFRAGHDLFVFDEAHTIQGRNLARSITSITYSDRILGVSNMIEFPNKVTWVSLGNNVSVNGDLARRVYRIRLAPTTPNPQDRDVSSYRHPDIKRWTADHRAELIAAALTLVRAWFTAGPDGGRGPENPNGRRFGSFEPWGGMVGGILDNAGVQGFLGSLVEWRSETDYETTWWADHLSWLHRQFGDTEFTVSDVVAKMRSSRSGTVEHPPRLEDHGAQGYNRTLGLAYGRVKGRVMNHLQLVKTAETSGHGNRWRVLDHRPGSNVSDLPQSVQGPDLDETASEGDGAVKSETFPPSEEGVNMQVSTPSGEMIDRIDGSLLHEENLYIHIHDIYKEKSVGTGTRVYPVYPNYPPAEVPGEAGADPLASLLPLCEPAQPRVCPDCDGPETLTPSGFWYACERCAPLTFTPRDGRV